MKPVKDRTTFLRFCRYLRRLYPPDVRIAISCGNLRSRLSTCEYSQVGDWADKSNVEIAYTPTYNSWLNRIVRNHRW
ncbi:hypothetical protein [Pseudofrankia asymbiotica]|uniref:Uncharacterized protein n=1 Tax=Pseudofrankia asymbiotica TaxID=1834516 RepID=A0A1V2HZG3_9ACTN|nr:hypothetical protein [Pseudofrankia asymbiotica]ONH21781.1 hypothetical protein BL253_37900 [Pseudofrankia asymbiotica]